jgi:cardiolipin synthase
MLEAIHRARETITMECYIFKTGEIGDRFIEALSARAHAGVRVTLVMDAIGSLGAVRKSAKLLRPAVTCNF